MSGFRAKPDDPDNLSLRYVTLLYMGELYPRSALASAIAQPRCAVCGCPPSSPSNNSQLIIANMEREKVKQRVAAPSRELRRARTDRDPNLVALVLN